MAGGRQSGLQKVVLLSLLSDVRRLVRIKDRIDVTTPLGFGKRVSGKDEFLRAETAETLQYPIIRISLDVFPKSSVRTVGDVGLWHILLDLGRGR